MACQGERTRSCLGTTCSKQLLCPPCSTSLALLMPCVCINVQHDMEWSRADADLYIRALHSHTAIPTASEPFVSDFSCSLCGDGGEIMCCERCPKVFHMACLHLDVEPDQFVCPFCICTERDSTAAVRSTQGRQLATEHASAVAVHSTHDNTAAVPSTHDSTTIVPSTHDRQLDNLDSLSVDSEDPYVQLPPNASSGSGQAVVGVGAGAGAGAAVAAASAGVSSADPRAWRPIPSAVHSAGGDGDCCAKCHVQGHLLACAQCQRMFHLCCLAQTLEVELAARSAATPQQGAVHLCVPCVLLLARPAEPPPVPLTLPLPLQPQAQQPPVGGKAPAKAAAGMPAVNKLAAASSNANRSPPAFAAESATPLPRPW